MEKEIFPFGKNKGKRYKDVDDRYLIWFYETVSKDICTEEYYQSAKELVLQEDIGHECLMESFN